MPLESNRTLHTWMKYYAQKQIAENMPAEPDKHDLLGFPNIEAEHPKWYIRKLWLVAENDRVEYPKSLDSNVLGLEKEAKKVIKKYVKNEHERYKELCGGAFLKKEAVHILKKLRFGQRIWGEDSGVETRLKSNLPGERPRWGVHTDSGYKSNDEDSIELWLRYWIAARIQNKINAPGKEKKCVSSVTVEHIAQPSPEPVPHLSELVQRSGSSNAPVLAPALKRRRNRFPSTIGGNSTADSSRSRSRARSGGSSDSEKSFSFASFVDTGSEVDFPQLLINRSKRPKTDIPRSRSHTRSPEQSVEVTSSAGINLPNDTSTNIFMSDMANKNNDIDVDEDTHSGTDEMKRKLQSDLTRFLTGEPNYTGILHEVIPPTKQLYAISPHRKPYSDFDIQFRNFNRALIHWESLIKRLRASPGTTQSPFEDPLQKLAAQANFEDRVAMFHNLGPRSHVEFPLESWTISLALFFEDLLGDAYMPFPFEVLVNNLRAVNQSLYDTIHCS